MLSLHSQDLINGVFHLNQEVEGAFELVSSYLNVTSPKYASGSDQLLFAFNTAIITDHDLVFTANPIYAFGTAVDLATDLTAFFAATGFPIIVANPNPTTVAIRRSAADNLEILPGSTMLPHLVMKKVNLGYDISYSPEALGPVDQLLIEFGNTAPQSSSFDRYSVLLSATEPKQKVIFERAKNISIDTFVVRDSLVPMPVTGIYHMLLRKVII